MGLGMGNIKVHTSSKETLAKTKHFKVHSTVKKQLDEWEIWAGANIQGGLSLILVLQTQHSAVYVPVTFTLRSSKSFSAI